MNLFNSARGTLQRQWSGLRARVESRNMPGWGGGNSAAGMSSFLPAPVMSGVAVTPETALTLTAVFACINVIATDTSALPLRVLRWLPGGGRELVREDPRHELVSLEPNEKSTSIRYRQAQLGHVLSWGNGYAEIESTHGGDPIAFHLLSPRPTDTWPVYTRSGKLSYKIDGGRRELPAESVLHIAGLGWDGLLGYSPIAFARQAVGLGIAAEQYGASFFGNGANPAGVIKFPGKLNKEGQSNLRESWERVHQGVINSHRTAVLVEGASWERITIPPEDAQFIETRKFQVVEICRLFRVPPHKVMDYSQAHLANLEESNLDYLNTTLIQWIEVIEQEYNRKLFTREERAQGLHVAHDLTALMRGNMQARATYYKTRFDIGSISPDEIREREGDNPYPGGKGRSAFVQLNLVPLGTDPPKSEPTAPPDDPARSEDRFNPHHGADGRFGSGSSHGGHAVVSGGKVHSAADLDALTAHVEGLGKSKGAAWSLHVREPRTQAEQKTVEKAGARGLHVLHERERAIHRVETAGDTTTHLVGGKVVAQVKPAANGKGFESHHTLDTGRGVEVIPTRTRKGAEYQAKGWAGYMHDRENGRHPDHSGVENLTARPADLHAHFAARVAETHDRPAADAHTRFTLIAKTHEH